MRKLILFVVLSLPFAADLSLAQANAMDIYCGACRDPVEHPRDYINFAFNQTYGPDAWLSFDQADDFFIVNADNRRVYVDVDFVMLGVGIEGLRLPFWPTNLAQIQIALPNGELYTALRSVFHQSLPVPASPASPNNRPRSGSGDGHGGRLCPDRPRFLGSGAAAAFA